MSPRHLVDLARKFAKAKQLKGPKLFLAFAPCPTGWLYDPAQTQEYARLAVDCGVFPLKEAVHGEVTHTYEAALGRWRNTCKGKGATGTCSSPRGRTR